MKYLRCLNWLAMIMLMVSVSVVAKGQTPTISGVGLNNSANPLYTAAYWSIYGSNLSGTNTATAFLFEIKYTQEFGGFYDVFQTNDGYPSPSPYFYASSTQVNFLAYTLDSEAFEEKTGNADVYDCHQAGGCSSPYGVFYYPLD